MKKFVLGVAVSLFLLSSSGLSVQLESVAKGFKRPVKLVLNPVDRSWLVVEQAGLIKYVKEGVNKYATFRDLSDRVFSGANETGLLGLALHPDFPKNGRYFVNYTSKISRDLFTIVSELNQKNKKEKILMKIKQPYANHNGGEVVFGPDGLLYISTGDGGAAGDPLNNAQNLKSLLGKILTLDVDSAKPKPKIFAYGLRNVWRFSFDAKTGKLWAGDVGQNELEEIDVIEKGKNYGWRVMEGSQCFNPKPCKRKGLITPIVEYPRKDGFSVTGGDVYHGTKIPSLKGTYIYGDYGSGKVWSLKFSDAGKVANNLLLDSKLNPSDFAIDQSGELLVIDLNGGVYRLKE